MFHDEVPSTSLFLDSSGSFTDDVSADGSADYPDRASMMEVRLQAQEDEITLLKASLAAALRRIHIHDQLLPLLKQQLIACECRPLKDLV